MNSNKTKDIPDVSLRSILESISDGVFTVDNNWLITSFNRAAEEITGIDRNEAIGSYCSDVFRSSMCENDCALRKTLHSGEPVVNKSCYIINARGEKIPISVSTAVLKDSRGNICGGAETFRDLREVQSLRQKLTAQYRIGDMVSRSSSMQEIFKLLPVYASTDTTLLINGETGTGKELFARAVHGISTRKDKPFIAVNCAALPDTLLESELFGYKKGAFTGAEKNKPGRFALAENGTLLLDEIGEISPTLQVKLLRVLQEKCYEPLGAVTSEKTNARIMAATNKDLGKLVDEGKFRQDLFYRINVISVKLPPLRERKEDIPLLVDFFISKFSRLQNKIIDSISPEALTLLMNHNWMGNIRELENVIERAFVLCTTNMIDTVHLPENITKFDISLSDADNLTSCRQKSEIQLICDTLKNNDYNRSATARELGIHKTTLYRKLKKYKIAIPESNHKLHI